MARCSGQDAKSPKTVHTTRSLLDEPCYARKRPAFHYGGIQVPKGSLNEEWSRLHHCPGDWTRSRPSVGSHPWIKASYAKTRSTAWRETVIRLWLVRYDGIFIFTVEETKFTGQILPMRNESDSASIPRFSLIMEWVN